MGAAFPCNDTARDRIAIEQRASPRCARSPRTRSGESLKFVKFIASIRLFRSALRTEPGRSALLLLLMLVTLRASAVSVSLAWDPPTGPVPSGYFLYYGSAAGDYDAKIDAGNSTSFTVSGLLEGATYHFAATSYNAARTESGFSNDVSATMPYATLTADFTVSADAGHAPLALNFVNSSTGDITSYSWVFGDGAASRVANPAHVYAAPGTYSVSLTVSGPAGIATKTCAGCVKVGSSSGWLQRTPTPDSGAFEDLRTRTGQRGVSPSSLLPASE